MLFSVRWTKKARKHDILTIQTTFLDPEGKLVAHTRFYRDWIGVCTGDIDKVLRELDFYFPGCEPRHVYLGDRTRVLPYFPTRLAAGKLAARVPKPFYKVYLTSNHAEVGRFMRKKHKIAYYDENEWLARLYIDLCRNETHGFYYKWYEVSDDSEWLLDSFRMHPELTDQPEWRIAAFDLETVPMDGAEDRVPTGLDGRDEIVMISVVKWSTSSGPSSPEERLFFRLPPNSPEEEEGYRCERQMLRDFHACLADCQVLTGYNINGFDIPCLFARLVWLGMPDLLRHYSSERMGTSVVATFRKMLVLDLYHYFKTFSSYDLPGFKLDDVARAKLGETKVPVDSTGLWAWYTRPEAGTLLGAAADECHAVLRPGRVPVERFGTFPQYKEYCLRDSQLVRRLFEKETVLSFAVERANFTAMDAVRALHLGNSNFLLDVLKTHGNALGFFLNYRALKSPVEARDYESTFTSKKDTFQGALNFCIPERTYTDVSVLDFNSMYPSAMLNKNLCYMSCTIMPRDEWLAYGSDRREGITVIPYRVHGDADFETGAMRVEERFRYPPADDGDAFVIVTDERHAGFLPSVVKHFIELRKEHQTKYKETRSPYHYNAQLCIKILVNSLYGVMANKNSCLAYPPIAMSIVTLARYQLLGSFHFLERKGYRVCYADTDSLMVQGWPTDDCRVVNEYLHLDHVELKFEQRMRRLMVLSRKRYVYETQRGKIVTKGFQKRVNALMERLTRIVLDSVWSTAFGEEGEEDAASLESRGWLLWMRVLQTALYECRDSRKYSICRKTKPLSEYKSTTCATVRMLQRYPERADDFIEYAYSRADVSQREASKWVLDPEDCRWVNYEQLIMGQKRMFCLLLNMAYWKRRAVPVDECDMVMNAIRWKQFMHAELLYRHRTGRRRIELLVEKGVRYTFRINNHLRKQTVRRPRGKKAVEASADPVVDDSARKGRGRPRKRKAERVGGGEMPRGRKRRKV